MQATLEFVAIALAKTVKVTPYPVPSTLTLTIPPQPVNHPSLESIATYQK